MKKVIVNIREFFWPLLDKEEVLQQAKASKVQLKIADENLEQAFDLKIKMFENEEERRKNVESKAALLINTISIATSIVVAANALVISNQFNNIAVKISIILSFIVCVYAIRTVWFSIKALQRGSYYVLCFDDINIAGNKNKYLKSLITSLSNKTQKNEKTINNKVDFLTLAQEYYKRAIVSVFLFSFLIVIYEFAIRTKEKETKPNTIMIPKAREKKKGSIENRQTLILFDSSSSSLSSSKNINKGQPPS